MGKTKDVRAAVEAELGFDPSVDAKDITVRNINGEVALNGTVPSYPQYREAAAAARRVTGVTRVHNHLEVVLPPGDFRDDTMLTTSANVALERNTTVPGGVEATAYDGDLTLTGTVAYGSERAAAESAVAGLTGVRHLTDDIDISYDADPVDVDLHVREALERSALVPDDSDVKADLKDGIITLTRPCPHLGRTRRSGRRRVDGQRRHRRSRRTPRRRLNARSCTCTRPFTGRLPWKNCPLIQIEEKYNDHF